jgi:hypothetical protein
VRLPDNLEDTQVRLSSSPRPAASTREAARQAVGYTGTLVLITRSSSLNLCEAVRQASLEDTQVN